MTIHCPLESISDLLGVNPSFVNNLLLVAGLLKKHNRFGTLFADLEVWEQLAAAFKLDIEVCKIDSVDYVGKKVWVLCVGRLCGHNNFSTFDAREQGYKIFCWWHVTVRQVCVRQRMGTKANQV